MTSQKKSLLDLYPESIDDIYLFLSKKFNIGPEVIRTITSHPLGAIKHKISKGEIKGALIHGLGSFETYEVSVNREIRNVLRAYRAKKLSREVTCSRITTLWNLRNTCKMHENKLNV